MADDQVCETAAGISPSFSQQATRATTGNEATISYHGKKGPSVSFSVISVSAHILP